MKILVVSGFLGCGKTTFIRQLIERRPARYCILENEVAPNSIDGTVLEQATGLKVWEVEGCICCTRDGDFRASVMTIASVVRPEVLIIETSGVSMLSRVMSQLRDIAHHHIEVLTPVAILDSAAFDLNLAEPVLVDQLQTDCVLVLSKTERLAAEDVRSLRVHLQGAASRDAFDYRTAPDRWWDELLQPISCTPVAAAASDRPWQTLGLSDISLSSPERLVYLLSGMACGEYGAISRAKGIVRSRHSLLKFDLTRDGFAITGFPESAPSAAVFIGRAFHAGNIAAAFGGQVVTGRALTDNQRIAVWDEDMLC